MPTFEKAPVEVATLATEIIARYDTHHSLSVAKPRIDFIFAFADRDGDNQPIGPALKLRGMRAYGIARKLPAVDRAKGCGDAEIKLDGDWWDGAEDEQRTALLDHELTHLTCVLGGEKGKEWALLDKQGRPVMALRKHDVEFGWFNCIAERHGSHSIERLQAKKLFDNLGQFYWPDIAPAQLKGKAA